MLSEAWRLLQALERSDIKRAPKHKRIQVPGRTWPIARICLDANNKVGSIRDVSKQDWRGIWTVMEGNQNSFPVVRFQGPLYRLPRTDNRWTRLGYDQDGRRKRAPDDQLRLEVLESLLQDDVSLALTDKAIRLFRRLTNQKAKELIQCAENDPGLRPVKIVAARFRDGAKEPRELLKQVSGRAIAGLRQGKFDAIDFVEQLFVGKGPPDAQGRVREATVQLAFDIENGEAEDSRLYSTTIRDRLIQVLPQAQDRKSQTRSGSKLPDARLDAFTGEAEEIEDKTFPKVDLPVPSGKDRAGAFGRRRFPLASMFSEARCNTRYGLTDALVFPLAKTRATKLKEALEEVTSDSRHEKTWQHVASGRFDLQGGRKIEKPDLLIAYVEEKPMLDAKTAGYFGQGPSVVEDKFEVDSAALCEAFRGVLREKPQAKLNLFLIREVSKGQAQVVLAESPAVKDVLEAAERWQQAVRENIPNVTIYLPERTIGGKKVAAVPNARPTATYPDQVVRLLSHQWIRGGSEEQPVVGPGLAEVLTLMLRTKGKWEPTAHRLLGLLLERVSPLLIGLFAAKHAYGPRITQGKREPLDDYPRQSRETALHAVAVSGILLNALASRKEDYMKDAPYQIGQMLALADTLHKDYCTVVRHGELPSSLIGTALMRRALDSPAGALAELSERIIEYVRWAKVAQISDEWKDENDQRRIAVNEARKKLRQYQTLADALGKLELPTECDDLMKAQLLLGFLATPPEED